MAALAKHYAEVSPSERQSAAEHGNYQGKNDWDDLAGVGYGGDSEPIQETAYRASKRRDDATGAFDHLFGTLLLARTLAEGDLRHVMRRAQRLAGRGVQTARRCGDPSPCCSADGTCRGDQ